MRTEIILTFRFEPHRGPLPAPILLGERQVGELLTYDPSTRSGKALLDGDLTVPDLIRLQVWNGVYAGLGIGGSEDTMIDSDIRQIRAVINLAPGIYGEDLVRHVMRALKGHCNPATVRQIVKEMGYDTRPEDKA